MSFSSLTPSQAKKECRSTRISVADSQIFVPPTTPCARYEWLQVLVAAVGLSLHVCGASEWYFSACVMSSTEWPCLW